MVKIWGGEFRHPIFSARTDEQFSMWIFWEIAPLKSRV